MSRPQYGIDMNGSTTGDIIGRARERAAAGLPREDHETFLRRLAAENNNNNNTQPATPQPVRPGPAGRNLPPGRQRQDRPQAPPGLQNKVGQIVLPISRPAPVPQWPLSNAMAGLTPAPDTEPYLPPSGSSPPRRPPRPSLVPSILDASKIQGPTPSFPYQAQHDRPYSEGVASSVPETPSTLSRPSTMSSVCSIPDFPLPTQSSSPMTTMPTPRRSMTLGPPPSARRGASSFYSNLFYVSPIPEESPRSRSHTSYASSAAMPEGWDTLSPHQSPRYQGAHSDDRILEDASSSEEASGNSGPEDDVYETRLVRSASVGRRGRAALVTTASAVTIREQMSVMSVMGEDAEPPSPHSSQPGPFAHGSDLLDASSHSSTTFQSSSTIRGFTGAAATDSTPLSPLAAVTDLHAVPRSMSGSPQIFQGTEPSGGFNRLSAIRQPPRPDKDVVREADMRGSLTSLPGLIRRATRLAASLDRGLRPASRIDLDDSPPGSHVVNDKHMTADLDSDEFYDDHYRSGISDMLAAFPPPVQAKSSNVGRRSIRESVLTWPLPPSTERTIGAGEAAKELIPDTTPPEYRDPSGGPTPDLLKTDRRCCGLPAWGFVLIMVLIVVLIAAAVIIPVEFFVVRHDGNNANNTPTAVQQCQSQLTCQNGGTVFVTNGICACICSNGFNGFDCSMSDSAGCTTTTVAGIDNSNINNVTLGNAIPRLLAQAAANFSIMLSETTILSKFNAGNLSCSSQNALVTFNGQSRRADAAFTNAVVAGPALKGANFAALPADSGGDPGADSTTIFIGIFGLLPPTTTITITHTVDPWPPPTPNVLPPPDPTPHTYPTSAPMLPPVPVIPPPIVPPPPPDFTVTPEVLDFARVVVLFVLQQDLLADAISAQTRLQSFFSSSVSDLTKTAAANVSLSNGHSVDLVNFRVDAGTGLVGGATDSAK